jgi:hypothetical protein
MIVTAWYWFVQFGLLYLMLNAAYWVVFYRVYGRLPRTPVTRRIMRNLEFVNNYRRAAKWAFYYSL